MQNNGLTFKTKQKTTTRWFGHIVIFDSNTKGNIWELTASLSLIKQITCQA